MATGSGEREHLRDEAARAARVVLAKHPAVIPSPWPKPPVSPAPPPSVRPLDLGARNIARFLAR